MKGLMKNIKKATGRIGIKIEKNLPEILLVGGVVSFAGTIVVACKATLDADEVIKHHNKKMEDIEKAYQIYMDEYDEEDPDTDEFYYPEETMKEDIKKQYIKTSVNVVKLYAPTIALGALSLACFLSSRNIMKKRYLGAVAAYNAVSEAFEAYRKRVREEVGVEMDRHYRYGTKMEKIDTEVTDENGKKKKVKEAVEQADKSLRMPSDTAVYFDDDNPNWDPNPAFNLMFLRAQQNYANDMLHSRGHLFLNEVYDMLGFSHTQAGSVLGWVVGMGDDYVDFGLYDQNKEDVRRFVNGKDNVVLLDFNHDGVIWDKI